MILGGLWASGADLAKKLEHVSKSYPGGVPLKTCLEVHLRSLSPKSGHLKIGCFSDPAFSAQNRPRAPQSEHHGRSGAQKVAKIEPKMMTFWGPAEKLKSEPGLRENPVEALPGGPRIAQNSMLFLKALPEVIFEVREPKQSARADFRPNWTDSQLPFGPLLAFWLFGGLNFR